MGRSESILLMPALVLCRLGRAVLQAAPSSCASSAATAAAFPLLSRTMTPLPAAQCCPAELWWEKKRGLGGCPCHPLHPRAVPRGSLAQAGTGGSSSGQCWGLGTSLLSSIFSRSFRILRWSLGWGGLETTKQGDVLQPPTPMLLGCGQSCQGKLLGGALHPQSAHQPLRQPLQLGWEQGQDGTEQDGTCTGQGYRGLRWEGAGVCVPPGTSTRGARAHTRDPHPKKARSGPSRHPTLTQAVPYQTRCLWVLPSLPWGPSILEGQTETPHNLCTTLGPSWGFINWRGWVSPPTGNS